MVWYEPQQANAGTTPHDATNSSLKSDALPKSSPSEMRDAKSTNTISYLQLTELVTRLKDDIRMAEEMPAEKILLKVNKSIAEAGITDEETATAVVQLVLDVTPLQRSIRSLEATITGLSPDDPCLPDLLKELGHRFKSKYEQTRELEDLHEAIKRTEEALAATHSNTKRHTEISGSLCTLLCMRHHELGVLDDLDRAIACIEAVTTSTQDRCHRSCRFSRLGSLHAYRYRESNAIEDLDKCIKWTEEAVAVASDGDPSRLDMFDVLRSSYETRYERLGVLGDLEKAIKWNTAAIIRTEKDPHLFCKLGHLARLHYLRYRRVKDIEDLNIAITLRQETTTATIPTCFTRETAVMNLWNLLRTRYQALERIDDINLAIELGVETLQATPSEESGRAGILKQVSKMYLQRFIQHGKIEDLEKSSHYAEERLAVIPLDHPDRADAATELAILFGEKYERSENISHIETGIKWAEEAAKGSIPDHPGHAERLKMLFWYRFWKSCDPEDLKQAIVWAKCQLRAVPQDGLERPGLLQSLARMYGQMYGRLGEQNDLDSQTKYAEESLKWCIPGSTTWAQNLEGLANSLHLRYRSSGAQQDLQRAITHIETVLLETPEDKYSRASTLATLARFLYSRYTHFGVLEDLEKSIELAEEALARLSPDDDRRNSILHFIHHRKYYLLEVHKNPSKDQGQDQETMEQLEKAINHDIDWANSSTLLPIYPVGSRLGALPGMLLAKHLHSGDVDDLDHAIESAEQAVKAIPPNHPHQADLLGTLSVLLLKRCRDLGVTKDIQYALRSSIEGWECKMAPPLDRIRAARTAASLLASRGKWKEASSLLESSIKILPQICPQFLEQHDQERILSEFTELGAHAASLALGAGKEASYCLGLLELSRGIIMGLAIDCRSDLTNLRLVDPGIFNKFSQLCTEIDSRYIPSKLQSGLESTYENWRRRREQVMREIDDTLDEIRKLPGFSGFQLPPSCDALMDAAKEGPIVVFNTSPFRSDAIIVTKSAIRVLPLQRLIYDEASEWMELMAGELVQSRSGASKLPLRNEKMEKLLLWLWDVAVEPVLEELQLETGNTPHDSDLTRIWWIGVGPLAMAPFHAAGDHSPNSTRNTFSHAISSYIPTIKALSYAREKKLEVLSKPESSISLLLVTMPTTPNARSLKGVEKEAKDIVREIGGNPGRKRTKLTQLNHPTATEVLDNLQSHRIVHFACHGVPDEMQPSNSHLLLLKEKSNDLEPDTVDRLTVETISNKNLSNAQVAYLSACSTAENRSKDLVDESLHIASAFQLAGFSHVLATLWESDDTACQEVAKEFYNRLFNSERRYEGHQQVSIAFHHAVKKLRDRKWRQPLLWASFIHTGA